ncbi:MAG TPA: hypothetical protein VJM51_02165, partial [Dehalococcoidia bacterium]|nr:hypothetical protein [Dehalococcoidia bacterium]
MAERRLEQAITELAEQLAGSAKTRGTFPLMPQWWQQVFLDLATKDEDFRVQALRFTDVLPTLRSDAAIADHAHQYFDAVMPQAARAAFGLVTQPSLRPWLAQMVRQSVFAMADRFI